MGGGSPSRSWTDDVTSIDDVMQNDVGCRILFVAHRLNDEARLPHLRSKDNADIIDDLIYSNLDKI
jgi:hypothetical protein